MTAATYHGSYRPLDGVRMSEAYASTLDISFDVRGGLLVRQIHHRAALLFMAAIMVHMLRIFFTGAYRKPRELPSRTAGRLDRVLTESISLPNTRADARGNDQARPAHSGNC